MGRATNRLTAKGVASARAGYHADGAGLYLLVTETGASSWVFRYRRQGKAREMGLGSAATYSLAEARQRAAAQRRLLADGQDPIEARRAALARVTRTWGQAVEDYVRAHAHGWRNAAQAAQWRQSLEAYGPAAALPVTAVDTALVVRLLRNIWNDKTETATRVRGRIERVWSAERAAGEVQGENPARWRGHLDAILPPPRKVTKVVHHAALPYADLPALMTELAAHDGRARRALRWTILTAARTSEATGLDWPELDLEAKLWTVPAERMKSGRPHEVPLTDAMLACLADLPRDAPPFPLSENAMLYLLQRAPPRGLGRAGVTVHGFRSTFRDWAAECTSFPSEVVEKALAHVIRDKTEAAYRRGPLLEKRRKLMEAWGAYCLGERRGLRVVRGVA